MVPNASVAVAEDDGPHEKKLDSKTVSSCFIGYSKRSKSYKFYDPTLGEPTLGSIFETGTATFFEDVEFGGRNKVRDIVFEEESVSIPIIAFDNVQVSVPIIDQEVNPDLQPDNVDQPPFKMRNSCNAKNIQMDLNKLKGKILVCINKKQKATSHDISSLQPAAGANKDES
ncbi:hypothetical protein EZV62_009370 [Acer yangbiense]|uniref:Retroviral polymerase SH3-like domain-containing protein n=1 Tax=Acer yangbiense TaxID=1000413 RepID=A0A5C7IGD2_9ROSI|nr:hypothetical protein EZV62_009370 [Acer yangbiense]